MIKSAIKASIPAVLCYFPLGIVYGLLFVQCGYPWYWAPLFSLFVYSGAIQFLTLTILLAGGSLLTLAIALIPLGFRNVFYGMAFFDRYKNCHPLLKGYLAHGLVDAPFSLLITGPRYEEKQDLRYITALTIVIHLSWILGTLIGTCIDYLFTLPQGLEFALPAFFAAAAVEQMQKKRELKPVLIAALSIALALIIAPHNLFLAGMGFAMVTILFLPKQERRVV